MASARLTRLLIEAMGRHLPPSASQLRLLDIDGAAGATLAEVRADLDIIALPAHPAAWPTVPPGSFDAVVAYEARLDAGFLQAALAALRPGGRLIVMHSSGEVSQAPVDTLEAAGYTRILVEVGAECPLPTGVLMRGEKPHTTGDTLARVGQVAHQDADALDLATFRGRYVHTLVIQTPNKPGWALAAGEQVRWQAVTAGAALLAFSSLPKAVNFMQQAVMQGRIVGVNKVARFSRETAAGWALPVLLNPTLQALDGLAIHLTDLDPATAEAPEE